MAKIKAEHLTNNKNVEAHSDWKTWHRDDWDFYPRTNMAKNTAHKEEFLNNDFSKWQEMQAKLYNAPAVLYLTIPKESPIWSSFDLGAFAQTIMLLAKNAGIDTMPAYEFVRFPEEVRSILAVPENEALAVGIGLGYASDHHFNDYEAPREDLKKVLEVFK